MTVVDDARVTPLTPNVTRSLRYGGELWTLVEDMPTVHGCSYFENNTEFYCKPMKLFESRGDVRLETDD